jgi:hypothetical protein
MREHQMRTTLQLDDDVLAAHHGGRLGSFDRRLSCEGVAGGREALWLIEA